MHEFGGIEDTLLSVCLPWALSPSSPEKQALLLWSSNRALTQPFTGFLSLLELKRRCLWPWQDSSVG